jgi:uncharacterized protein YwgA
MTTAPWQHRYAVILKLAKLYKEKEGWVLGKTALQKLVFFLQEVRGVELGYDYTLYTFGPFSSTLAADLDFANMMDVVDVTYHSDLGGYEIVASKEGLAVERHAKQWLKSVNSDLEAVFEGFGRFGTRALELRATIAYVAKDALARQRALTDDRLVRIVHDLKPHFDPDTIRAALEELRDESFLPESPKAKAAPSLIRRLTRRR